MQLSFVLVLALLACCAAQNPLGDCWITGSACDPIACTEEESQLCDDLALCDKAVLPVLGCHCPEGFIGGGCIASGDIDCGRSGCDSEGWTARVTVDVTGKKIDGADIEPDYNNKIVGITFAHKRAWANLFGLDINNLFALASLHHTLEDVTVWENGAAVTKTQLSINMLFPSESFEEAQGAADSFNALKEDSWGTDIAPFVFDGSYVFGAKVYRWKQQTTSAPTSIQATGMQVDFVQFDPACKGSGCWVIDVTYTAGARTGNFNTFYLPRVQDSGTWQEENSYDTVWTSTTVWDTYFPKYFPCGSNVDKSKWSYSNVDNVNSAETGFTSTCCLANFIENYRVVQGFEDYFDGACPETGPSGQTTIRTADLIDRPGFVEETPYTMEFPAARPFLSGDFSDINATAEYISLLDPFIGQHTARIRIDEVELRRKAGLLTGTVGVEYTVDTFIGFANFRPTGTIVLDSAAMQVNLHLEKTNFFSVSTEGVNAYTFLEYVNMRLVTVYKEDVVFGGESEDNTDPTKAFDTNFYQTSDEGSADYVQVTFTMGDQYSPNPIGMPFDGGLIPLNSVRAGKGAFFDDDVMEHKCLDYHNFPGSFWLPPAQRGGPPTVQRRSQQPSNPSHGGATPNKPVDSPAGRGLKQTTKDAVAKNQTWGPLNSCQEQARCMHIEWNQLAGSVCNAGGACEYEVCMVFSASLDPGCKVWEPCTPPVDCYFYGELCSPAQELSCPPGSPFGVALDGSPGVFCVPDLNYCDDQGSDGGPGDLNEEYYYGNLYMWCADTTVDCPADTDYPLLEVEYFKPQSRQNITKNARTCQRGKPGQKLFFVMQDGEECLNVQTSPSAAFKLPGAHKALWSNAGYQWPSGAEAFCEPRHGVIDQCPPCNGNQLGVDGEIINRGNLDGTAPCGCSMESASTPSSDEKDISGFDTCTNGGNQFGPGLHAECVWTVVLPDDCDSCTCGFNKETGECTICNPNNNCPNRAFPPTFPGSTPPSDFACCGDFNSRLCQDCAPGANMCVSPISTPDNFVSYNIPLGVDWYPEPSNDLSQNVFVHMVINALDSSGCDNPNQGCDPLQVKTTLFGSIPVVEGGINIFCDGVRAKTDLVDVANADIVVGTAASQSELSRLRILKDIASTSLSKFEGETTIDSDSIEAGFLTLILKGNSSFFELRNTKRFGLELEDLITIHIMEPDSTMFTEVNDLLGAPPTDNYDTTTNNLIDAGYELNGAFRFTINRIENRASLEPTAALLAKCPFNPPRPSYDVPFPTTCVTRRDVRHRGFPNRAGALSTAMEVVPLLDVAAGTCVSKDPDDLVTGVYPKRSNEDGWGFCGTDCTMNQNAKFMQNVLGASDYADGLGRDYSCVIAQKYKLDSRYNRAWWINPSYEWTPTQTGGQPIFTVSQKIFLFALVNLNEQFGASSVADSGIPAPQGPKLSRRRLLSNTQNTGSGMSASVMEFDVTPSKMLADSFSVPVDKVATWKITFALTADQACMEPAELQKAIRGVLGGYSLDHVSNYEALLITSMTVDKDGIQCPARRSSRRLLNNPTATVEMMIVFAAGANANIDVDSFKSSPGIMTMEAVEVSPKVGTTAGDWTRATPEPEESSGSNIALIAGCAAGGAVLLLGGGFLLWRMNKPSAEAEVASALPDLAALKSQLQSEAA